VSFVAEKIRGAGTRGDGRKMELLEKEGDGAADKTCRSIAFPDVKGDVLAGIEFKIITLRGEKGMRGGKKEV